MHGEPEQVSGCTERVPLTLGEFLLWLTFPIVAAIIVAGLIILTRRTPPDKENHDEGHREG